MKEGNIMTIHKCDICKKEMYSWLTIYINVDAAYPECNIANLLQYINKIDICESCFNNYKHLLKE